MRIDLWVPTANPFTTPELLAVIGTEAEQRGVGTIWVGEHVVLFDEYDSSYPYAEDGRIPAPPGSGLLEPLSTLSYLAALTSTVRLGTAMVLLPQRNPVYTAKEVSTLDWLSNGRVDFGVGVGWLEEEFNAVNVPWPHRGSAPTSTSRCCGPCGATRPRPTKGSSTRSIRAPCSRSRCSNPIPLSTSEGRAMRPWPAPPGPARDGTPSTGSPMSWPSPWASWIGSWPSRAAPAPT